MKRALLACLVLGAAGAHAQPVLGVSAATLEAQLAEQRAAVQLAREEKRTLDAQLDALPAKQEALHHELRRDVRTLMRLRRGGMLPLVSGLDALLGHASRVTHYEKLAGRTLAELSLAREQATQLGQDALALSAKIAASEQELQELEQRQRELLEPEQDHARVASVPAPPSPDPRGYGLTLLSSEPAVAQGERFTDQVGGLAMPVAGQVGITDAERPGGDGAGLLFEAKSGASVRAAHGGRVTFAGRDDRHGMAVIVEHDHRYQTFYGGLAGVDVQVGDAVSKSARIGSAGSAPIYFEVRRGSRSQDARRWLGL